MLEGCFHAGLQPGPEIERNDFMYDFSTVSPGNIRGRFTLRANAGAVKEGRRRFSSALKAFFLIDHL